MKQDYQIWLEYPVIPKAMGSGWAWILFELANALQQRNQLALNGLKHSALPTTLIRARLIIVGLIAERRCVDFRLLNLPKKVRSELLAIANVWESCQDIVSELCFRSPNCPFPAPKSTPAEILYAAIEEGVLLPPFGQFFNGQKPGKVEFVRQLSSQNAALRSLELREKDFDFSSYSFYLASWACKTAETNRWFQRERLKPFINARRECISHLLKDGVTYHATDQGDVLCRQGRRKTFSETPP